MGGIILDALKAVVRQHGDSLPGAREGVPSTRGIAALVPASVRAATGRRVRRRAPPARGAPGAQRQARSSS